MQDYHVVQLSGGKDSTAMLLMMLERGMPIDEIIFCDTTVEFPQMYEHLDKLESYIGRPITRLRAKESFEEGLLDHIRLRGKRKGEAGYDWPLPRVRWCTNLLKRLPSKWYLDELEQDYNVILYMGIAADEPERIREHRYPLYEWGITEREALEYCYSKGFDWGGLYELFDRLSCWCCPLQSLKELRVLRKHFPELWDKLLYWDSLTRNKFRKDYSVAELEEKFRKEDLA